MMGNFQGPGGSFKVDLVDFDDNFSMFSTINTKKNKQRRIGKEGSGRPMKKAKRQFGRKGLQFLMLQVIGSILIYMQTCFRSIDL